jgi:hypothetical protein
MHINGQQLTKNLQKSRNITIKHGKEEKNENGRI